METGQRANDRWRAASAQPHPPATDEEIQQAELVIPGDSEEVAEEIRAVSPEGKPGDPKAGPRMLRAELLIALGLFMVAAVAIGIFVSPAAGLVVLGIALLGMVFNPVVGATLARAQEREEIVQHKLQDKPDHTPRRK